MSSSQIGGGKLPGKTLYAGRRRAMTRNSGFKVHADTTGGEFKRQSIKTYKLNTGEILRVTFSLVGHKAGDLLGYGMWFWCSPGFSLPLWPGVALSVSGGPEKRTLTEYGEGSWNKVGSIWAAADNR